MTTKSRLRKALTALEARRLELERLISDDLERKFLTTQEQVMQTPAVTYSQTDGLTFATASTTSNAGFSTVTWVG